MRIGVVHTQKERLVALCKKSRGVACVACKILAREVRGLDRSKVERERGTGFYMQLPNQTSSVARRLQTADQVRSILSIHPELPRRQTDLPVLMRIQSRQQRSPRLTASRLRNKRVVEANSLGRQPVEHRSANVRIAVAAKLGPIVFRNNQ